MTQKTPDLKAWTTWIGTASCDKAIHDAITGDHAAALRAAFVAGYQATGSTWINCNDRLPETDSAKTATQDAEALGWELAEEVSV